MAGTAQSPPPAQSRSSSSAGRTVGTPHDRTSPLFSDRAFCRSNHPLAPTCRDTRFRLQFGARSASIILVNCSIVRHGRSTVRATQLVAKVDWLPHAATSRVVDAYGPRGSFRDQGRRREVNIPRQKPGALGFGAAQSGRKPRPRPATHEHMLSSSRLVTLSEPPYP